MNKIKDINISIGKDKIRTGVIFLSGFAAGGIISAIAVRIKLKNVADKKALEKISETHNLAAQSINRACKALDALDEKTKTLESEIENSIVERSKTF